MRGGGTWDHLSDYLVDPRGEVGERGMKDWGSGDG